ncbi:hypothetical protein V4Y05_08880 [Pseudomonas chlororaphis subsp. chlororaphis]|nr:hypothetical protein [Pseudomonas chlororaphis]AZD00801.1 hypothetical protein C4K27_1592 [Pseudomonas chlororaphis subsp. chlororaphis]MBM0284384.1 hypothetical protein [Pseudomonas chlororaphis]MDO1505163.1 hypothetical protein [Pseudomonas chlororaphis]ORM50348.1 hypothetical protein B6D51_04220 [Pseudomonas chlororaphis subsp. chlororaphis]TWR99632.1 hypothetical protein FJD36_06620 [Pseudomonas chlororaphis subsp. chlororaphis]
MNFDQALLDDMWNGEKSICFFVNKGKCYWVLDYKYNFSLDAERDYRGYLSKGYITQDQYVQACKGFRGGVLKLTSDNFLQYISGIRECVFVSEDFKGIFDVDGKCNAGKLLRRVEEYYLSGVELDADEFSFAGRLASRLPMFYINFDRKIYMHMDFGRFHEDLAYPDWLSKCSDFSFLIPDIERYWVQGGDYWKLRFVQAPC